MEPVGVVLESSWSALNSVTTVEGTDLMAQFLVTHSLSNEQNDEPSLVMKSLFWPVQTIDSYYGSQDINTNMHHWFMDNSVYFSAGSYSNKPTSEYETYSSTMESNMISSTEMRSELAMLNVKEEAIKKSTAIPSDQNNQFDGKISMTADDTGEICTHYIKKSKGKRRIHVCDSLIDVHKVEKPAASPEKKARSPPSQAGYSSKRSKYKKDDSDVNMVDMELDNTAPFMQSSSCNISEDETNFSDEFNGGGCISASPKRSASLNLSGKARAGRGSATDPQSIYARKRRERINERLRILQKLVPNGTKVDISTMLEEAVQYVKFLQVQIKLLSSDKLWMYAPIAYNGTDIGFDLKNIPS